MNYLLLFISFLGFITAFYTIIALRLGAPFLPTRKKHLTVFEELAIEKGTVFVDLGSGDGRLVFEAARRGAEARGIEVQPILHSIA